MTANMMAAPATMLKGWGQTSDRDNDCSFERHGQKLTVRVPGTVHDLASNKEQSERTDGHGPHRGEFIAIEQSMGAFALARLR